MDIHEKLNRHTCGELSCDECSEQRAEAAREIARLREAMEALLDWGNTLPDMASERQRAEYAADYARARSLLPNAKDETRREMAR